MASSVHVHIGSIQPEQREEPKDLGLSFATEPIVGWRVWDVVQYAFHGGGSEPRLQAYGKHTIWQPRQRMEAECHGGPGLFFGPTISDPVHQAPRPGCSCGFYAFRSRDDALHMAGTAESHRAVAVGAVSLWGRVVELERGWRAQYAYPRRLSLFNAGEHLAADLSDVYGVPVLVGREDIAWPSIRIQFVGTAPRLFAPGVFQRLMLGVPVAPAWDEVLVAMPGDVVDAIENATATGLVFTEIGWLPPTDADVVNRISP